MSFRGHTAAQRPPGDALGIVNDGEVIDDVDGVELALLLAQVAADAAHVALAAGIGAALVVRAGDDDVGVVGHGDDDLARAHGGALQAAGALLGIDLRHAVHDVDGVKAARRDARAEAEAAARAGRGAVAADEHGRAAVVDAVVAGLGGVVAAARTMATTRSSLRP